MRSFTNTNLYTLNASNLEKGDIILTTSINKMSNIIRIVAFGPFSHAMLYLGDYSCVDSGGPGIRVASQNIQRIFFESVKFCSVLRLINKPPELMMEKVINYARRLIGTEYSISEVRLVALRVHFPAKEINRQFCSRYVAQAYESAGIILTNNPDYCSPVDLYNSHYLKKIKNPLRIASETEINIFSKESLSLSAKDCADEYIFSNAKSLTGSDIQTLEQFNEFLLNNPQFDNDFSTILNDSGYLDLWKIEKKENPYFYDYNTLKNKMPDAIALKIFCSKQLIAETEIRK